MPRTRRKTHESDDYGTRDRRPKKHGFRPILIREPPPQRRGERHRDRRRRIQKPRPRRRIPRAFDPELLDIKRHERHHEHEPRRRRKLRNEKRREGEFPFRVEAHHTCLRPGSAYASLVDDESGIIRFFGVSPEYSPHSGYSSPSYSPSEDGFSVFSGVASPRFGCLFDLNKPSASVHSNYDNFHMSGDAMHTLRSSACRPEFGRGTFARHGSATLRATFREEFRRSLSGEASPPSR